MSQTGPTTDATLEPAGKGSREALLEVTGLTTAFPTGRGVAFAVNNVSFSMDAGETKGVVGESGSGKSMTLRSILGLVSWPGAVVAGSVRWQGRELVGMRERELRRLRGAEISMIFQDPTSALNPVLSIGDQIAEPLRVHRRLSRSAARKEAVALLGRVGIPSPTSRVDAYPHQLSGGMRQRAMIAIAICCQPRLVLADEPTTNLDVTIQDQILNLLAGLQEDYGMALVLVSHDLGVVAQNADSVVVMYGGYVVEELPTVALFRDRLHPYTAGLIRALPTLETTRRTLVPISGQPPELDELPPGCPFQPRCTFVRSACADIDMTLLAIAPEHTTACPFQTYSLPDESP